METDSTFGGRIEKQDPEASAVLQMILKRPGMYVGSARFDYVEHLFGGYRLGRGLEFELDFLPNNELQYWLLHTQSASVSGSISGTTLFYRCFGSREAAFENYKVFLNATILLDSNSVYSELWTYKEKHNIVPYYWKKDMPPDYYPKLAQTVIDSIIKMIDHAELTYDKLKIYIRKERLFNQVRFLFHSDDKWVDDSEIIAKPKNHEFLIEMHVNAENTTSEALRNCGCDVFDTYNYDDNKLPIGDTFTDEAASFSSEFLRWKDEVTAS